MDVCCRFLTWDLEVRLKYVLVLNTKGAILRSTLPCQVGPGPRSVPLGQGGTGDSNIEKLRGQRKSIVPLVQRDSEWEGELVFPP